MLQSPSTATRHEGVFARTHEIISLDYATLDVLACLRRCMLS